MPGANGPSIHEIKVYRLFKAHPDRWFSNQEIHDQVEGVAPRTVRATTRRLAQACILNEAEVFPSHRFRLNPNDRDGRAYIDQLEFAEAIFFPSDGLRLVEES